MTMKPSKYVQVAMLRGLFKPWKQPIFYDFDFPMTSSALTDIIEQLKNIEFSVVAVVSDLGATNSALRRNLNITSETPYFLLPSDITRKVFVFADTPHLVKLLRNHFLDSGFIVNGKLLTKESIEKIIELEEKSDLKISFKVTSMHLNVARANRQKVKYAVQLFSNTVSSSIRRCVALGRADTNLQVSVSSNCSNSTVDEEVPTQTILSSVGAEEDPVLGEEEVLQEADDEEKENIPDIIEYDELQEDALEYVAGYIAKKLKLNEEYARNSNENTQDYTWVNEISEGGLKKPTREYIEKIKKLEDIFNSVNEDALSCRIGYMKNLLNKSVEVGLSHEIKSLFFRCRTYFRIRTMNKNYVININNKKANRKNKKTFT